MYKGASQGLQKRHAVDRPHPSRGYIDSSPDPLDVLADASRMTLDQAQEERRQLALEITRCEHDIMIARAARRERDARSAGQRKCALQARQKAVNVRIREINRSTSGDVLSQAIRDVVGEETAARIFARAKELRLASADTHPKDGDSTKIKAPLVSGAVPHEDEADAQETSPK